MNIQNFINKNSVILCSSKEDSELLGKLLHDAGYRWSDGERYTTSMNWEEYASNTCYRPISGTYCGKSYYLYRKYNIYDFSKIKNTSKNFINNDFIKRIYVK